MGERTTKRGYRLGDYQAITESKTLEGYPSWKGWRVTLFNFLKREGYGEINSDSEPLLHEWYLLRRQAQLGHKDEDEVRNEMVEMQDNNPEIFSQKIVGAAVGYINQKTQRPPKYKIKR